MKNNKQRENKNCRNARKDNVKLNADFENNHVSIECYHKLNRIIAVSDLVRFNLYKSELITSSNAGVSQLLSYFSDDVRDILHELKGKGLCDEWVR